MKKLRITVDGKVFDVSVELLDQVSSTTAAPPPHLWPLPLLPHPHPWPPRLRLPGTCARTAAAGRPETCQPACRRLFLTWPLAPP